MNKIIKTWQERKAADPAHPPSLAAGDDSYYRNCETMDLRAYIEELEEWVTKFAADGDALAAKLDACARPAAPVVAEGLTRYDPSRTGEMDKTPVGEYVLFADVVQLLAAHPVAGSPAEAVNIAADYIDAKAEKYLEDSADTEHDTGATVFHYGEAGRDYHSTLVELAEEIRGLTTLATFPERDLSKPAEQQGMFRKFDVRRVDGSDQPGGKHYSCRYYVLDLTHDQHAPPAMRAYAASCAVTHPQLAADIVAEFGEPMPVSDAPDCETCAYAESTNDDRGMFCHLHIKNVTEPCAEYQGVFIDSTRTAAPVPASEAASVPDDAIAKSKRILALVDDYVDAHHFNTIDKARNVRTALRIALMDSFAAPAAPTDKKG